jgi:hypothetical protein
VSDTPPSRFAWDWAGGWTLVFAGNLVLPLMLASGNVSRNGWFGLVGGLAVLFWIGFAVCLYRFRVSRSLVTGGALVAFSQFIPILHPVCGVFAMKVWEDVGGAEIEPRDEISPGRLGPLGAFVVVLLTAQPLVALSVLLGTFVRWRYGDTPLWSNSRTDPDAEPTAVADSPP